MNITSFYQTLRSTTPTELYNIIFHSYYYPLYYIFHVVYICMNIRLTTNSAGLSWYRSIVLTYCLSISAPFLLQTFLMIELPEFVEMKSFKGFFVVWSLFNICPFDLIFIIMNRPPLLFAIQVIDQFTVAQCVVNTCKVATEIFEGQFLRILIIAICSTCSPILIDLFDRHIILQRYEPMAYEIHYSKRLIAAVLITICFHDSVDMNVFLSLLFSFLSVLDLILSNGEVFRTYDFIFPNFWTKYATFNPNPTNEDRHEE